MVTLAALLCGRLLHVFAANKDVFLKRDQKPTDRTELEAADRRSAWVTLAEKFRDKDFDPSVRQPHVHERAEAWRKLRAGPTDLQVDGLLLQKHFTSYRAKLVKAIAAFKLSGNGDGREMTEEEAGQVNTVWSASFVNFCGGDIVLEYMYEICLDHGLLESAQTAMPSRTGHDSKSSRTVRGGRRNTTGARAAKGHLKPGTSDRSRAAKRHRDILDALELPVRVAKSAKEKEAAYHVHGSPPLL